MPQKKIARHKISPPHLHVTLNAFQQLELILENDYTLFGLGIRLQIKGKGCDGFTYSVGPTAPDASDFVLEIPSPLSGRSILFLFDPFTAFYLQEVTLDFIQDVYNGEEGLVVINRQQEHFHGKFWKENQELIPPQF